MIVSANCDLRLPVSWRSVFSSDVPGLGCIVAIAQPAYHSPNGLILHPKWCAFSKLPWVRGIS